MSLSYGKSNEKTVHSSEKMKKVIDVPLKNLLWRDICFWGMDRCEINYLNAEKKVKVKLFLQKCLLFPV